MTIMPGVAPLGVVTEKPAKSRDDESRILRASLRYFEKPAPGRNRVGDCESAILGALRRYFRTTGDNG